MAVDKHKITGTTLRAEPEEVAAARAEFPPGRSMEAFHRACLRAIAAEPERVRTLLAQYWPPEKPRGRPRTRRPTTD